MAQVKVLHNPWLALLSIGKETCKRPFYFPHRTTKVSRSSPILPITFTRYMAGGRALTSRVERKGVCNTKLPLRSYTSTVRASKASSISSAEPHRPGWETPKRRPLLHTRLDLKYLKAASHPTVSNPYLPDRDLSL